MILPDDLDEKVEFWVGEADTDSEEGDASGSDGETVVETRHHHHHQKTGRQIWRRSSTKSSSTPRRKAKSENGVVDAPAARKRRIVLGNGLLAVSSSTSSDGRSSKKRSPPTFALQLDMRAAGIGAVGDTRQASEKEGRKQRKTSRYGVIGGLPDTGSAPSLSSPSTSSASPSTPQYTSRKEASSTSSVTLTGHERRWAAMRPPGLGLDLWSDYVSPRQQAATTTSTTPKTPKYSESSGVRFDAHASLSQPPPSPAPSIDEEPPIARAGAAAVSADERRIKGASGRRTPTNMFGAVWDWAWHWR